MTTLSPPRPHTTTPQVPRSAPASIVGAPEPAHTGVPVGEVRVLVVAAQAMLRSGLGLLLSQEPDITVVGEASSARRALGQVRPLRPDVVLLEVASTDATELDAVRELTSACQPHRKVLVMTSVDLDDLVIDVLRCEASGYLLNDVTAEDLIRAIRTVALGDAVIAPRITRRLLDRYATMLPQPHAPSEVMYEALTEREREVLTCVAAGRSNAEIAAGMFLSETTVKTHISHILSKLGLRDRVQATVFAYESGLVQPGR